MQLTRSFSLAELTVTNQRVPNTPSNKEIENLRALAVHILQPLRDFIGRPIIVNSGFRSLQVNRLVGGSATSQHVLGQAADIVVEGMSPLELAKIIAEMELPYDQLIREPTWVHVSYGPRHRRERLTMRRVNGRSKYTAGLI